MPPVGSNPDAASGAGSGAGGNPAEWDEYQAKVRAWEEYQAKLRAYQDYKAKLREWEETQAEPSSPPDAAPAVESATSAAAPAEPATPGPVADAAAAPAPVAAEAKPSAPAAVDAAPVSTEPQPPPAAPGLIPGPSVPESKPMASAPVLGQPGSAGPHQPAFGQPITPGAYGAAAPGGAAGRGIGQGGMGVAPWQQSLPPTASPMGRPTPVGPPAPKPKKKGRLVPVLVSVLVTALVVGGGLTAVWFFWLSKGGRPLDQADVERQVAEMLTADFKIEPDESSVTCPSDMVDREQNKYICTYLRAGTEGKVEINLINKGQFTVGLVGEGVPAPIEDPLHTGDSPSAGQGWLDYSPEGWTVGRPDDSEETQEDE
jgi:hypothetical protein